MTGLLSLPCELRQAIYGYLIPCEIQIIYGYHGKRILFKDHELGPVLHKLLAISRSTRAEAFDVLSRSSLVLEGMEIFMPVHQIATMLAAYQKWVATDGAGRDLWKNAKKITFYTGSPTDGRFESASEILMLQQCTSMLRPTDAFKRLLSYSGVAHGELRLRIKTIAPSPGLPFLTEINVSELPSAMLDARRWISRVKKRLSNRLGDLNFRGRFEAYNAALPHVVNELHKTHAEIIRRKQQE